jgi:DNA-binding CsgD family transcriptional regulator
LPAPQARALEAVLARRDAPPGDRFAIGAAVVSLLGCGERRSTVVVDDAHWLDAASADALLFAARRLRTEGVAMLVATRPGGVFDGERTGLPRLRIAGLDPDSARALLAAEHGELPSGVVRLLVDHTQGNPLALLEMPRLLSDAQLAGVQPIDQPLPVGSTLQRALLGRLRGLPDEARRGLLVAAAGGSGRLQPMVDALAELGLSGAVLDAAEEAGALTIAGSRFEFAHPLLRSAIYHNASGPARREAHAALARATDGEARAWHQAHAIVGEDESVAASLEAVGLDAGRRGAPAAAAAALERAACASAPGEKRVWRLTEAARNAQLAGHLNAAMRLLDDALAGVHGAVQRAHIQHVRGRILVSQGDSDLAFRLLTGEAERVRDLDPDRAAAMLAEACLHCLIETDIRRMIASAREARRVAERASLDVRAYTAVMLACALIMSGERAEASILLDEFLPVLRAGDPLTEAGWLVGVAAHCYFWLDRYDVASDLLSRLIASARKASTPAALLLPLSCRAELDLRAGRWSIAAAQLHEAADLGEELADSVQAAYAYECLARLAAAAGDEPRCRDHARRAITIVEEHDMKLGRLYVASALGLLELGLGRVAATIQRLERVRHLADRNGLAEPNIVHWQPDLIEAYVRAGDLDAARHALDSLEQQAQRTGGHWALGTAARYRALLTDGPVAYDYFDASLQHLEAVKAPFEIARTKLCRGERLRRAGHRNDARRILRDAREIFEELGATPWAARAASELRGTGAKPRRRTNHGARDELTAHELQVALVVAGGASNREAAAALFLSPKTIEFHLAHIYPKLGVRGRTELAALAVRQGWLDAPGHASNQD